MLLNEARNAGCEIVEFEEQRAIDLKTRRMPLYLVIDPPPHLRLMREEIFGPILPIIPYETLADAITQVNDGDRPLGLYVFGENQALIENVLSATHSGGARVSRVFQSAGHRLARLQRFDRCVLRPLHQCQCNSGGGNKD